MSEATKVVGLVCAAGVGSRMGLGSPKQYMKFGSEAMLVHTVRALRARPSAWARSSCREPDGSLHRRRGAPLS